MLAACLSELHAGTPSEFLWAKGGGSISDDYANSIAVDAAGNSIVTGRFTGNASFLGTNIVSSGQDEIYLMKLNPSGGRVWLKQAGGTNTDEAYSTALDSLGNIYIAGRFTSTATFGTTNLTSAGTHDMFLAKYDPNGNFLWARRGGGTNVDYANAVCTDTSGNVFVTGIFSSTATFGNVVLTSGGNRDIFVVKYDAAGNVLWANSFGSTANDVGFSIAADNAGNVFVSGWVVGAVTLAGITANALGAQDIFLAKYDPNGIAQWLRRAGGSGAFDYGYSVAVDTLGNPYVCGSFKSTATFGNTNLVSSGSADIALAKYDTAGNFLWAQKAGSSTGDDEAYSVVIDRAGNAFLTGYFRGTASFSGTNVTSSGQHDLFIAKYGSTGTLGWIQKGGGTNYDYGNSIALDSLGNAFVAGVFFSRASLGTNIVTSVGGSDFLVTKLSTTTIPFISDVGNQTINENAVGALIPFNVSDLETPASNLVVSATSSNLALLPISRMIFGGSGTNRNVSISPATNQSGTTLITLIVTDSDGITNSDSFLLTVSSVNHAPVLTPVGTQVVNEETALLVTNIATDVDANTLTFSLLSAPAGASISTNGVFSWVPTEAQGPNTNIVSVRVTDNGTPNLNSTNSFAVVANEINTAPIISVPSNVLMDAGIPFFLTNSAVDSDIPANTVTYSLVAAPQGAAITAQGVFSWTPSANQAANTNIVRIRA
ncbi:MAG: SBBP repeat-containing protein, partial [Verrucomicrobiota bacterium]